MKTITVKLNISDEVAKSLNKKECIDTYVSDLVERNLTRVAKLGNGFTYDQIDKVLKIGNKETKLTNLEFRLFDLLLQNKGEIVSIDTIHNVAWKGRNMTRFTLRNKIKSLRDKTFYQLFKNHSNIGYSMEVF